MKSVHLLALVTLIVSLFSPATHALNCSDKKITLLARYGDKGEFPTELMDRWSEQSGNLIGVEINSKEAFSKLDLVLTSPTSNPLKTISLKLKSNKSNHFDFIKLIASLKDRPEKAQFNLYSKNGILFCTEEFAIFKGNETGAVEVSHEKK